MSTVNPWQGTLDDGRDGASVSMSGPGLSGSGLSDSEGSGSEDSGVLDRLQLEGMSDVSTGMSRPPLRSAVDQTPAVSEEDDEEVRLPERPPMLLRRREFRGDQVAMPASGPARSDVEPFRRRGVVAIHRRQRRVLAWARSILVVVMAVGIPTLLAFWVASSPRFALAEINVANADRIDAAWVRGALAPLDGENLPSLSLSRARDLLHGHPWLDEVTLQKRLPRTLLVAVTERRPEAVELREAGPVFVDAQGPIAPVGPTDTIDALPLIAGAHQGPELSVAALRVVREVASLEALALEAVAIEPTSSQPAALVEPALSVALGSLGALERLDVVAPENILLTLSEVPFPVRVQPDSLTQRQQALVRLLPELRLRSDQISVVDLRFDGRIIVETVEYGGVEPPRPGIRPGNKG